MNVTDIANQVRNLTEQIILIYAFNSTGKTRLSVAYKDATKDPESGNHTGVYYNAYSEDLFVWENEEDIRLKVIASSLNEFHSLLDEEAIRAKLRPFRPRFDFSFKHCTDLEQGIESISFYLIEDEEQANIKISSGESRIFVWCFFLALFEIEGWADKQPGHFFIDDPVSSLDDYNIFVIASTLFDLIETHYENRKFIITTHHIGIFSILYDWLTKGEKRDKFEKKTKPYLLTNKTGQLTLENPRNDVFLYHLHLLQVLERAQEEQLYTFHFALLRQVLENIASFLGVGRFSYVLTQVGITDTEQSARIINALSHQKVYHYQTEVMNPDNEALFKEIFSAIKEKYQFVLHAG